MIRFNKRSSQRGLPITPEDIDFLHNLARKLEIREDLQSLSKELRNIADKLSSALSIK